jgi:hypothetical protein
MLGTFLMLVSGCCLVIIVGFVALCGSSKRIVNCYGVLNFDHVRDDH